MLRCIGSPGSFAESFSAGARCFSLRGTGGAAEKRLVPIKNALVNGLQTVSPADIVCGGYFCFSLRASALRGLVFCLASDAGESGREFFAVGKADRHASAKIPNDAHFGRALKQ